jgi:hypothetical protein
MPAGRLPEGGGLSNLRRLLRPFRPNIAAVGRVVAERFN